MQNMENVIVVYFFILRSRSFTFFAILAGGLFITLLKLKARESPMIIPSFACPGHFLIISITYTFSTDPTSTHGSCISASVVGAGPYLFLCRSSITTLVQALLPLAGLFCAKPWIPACLHLLLIPTSYPPTKVKHHHFLYLLHDVSQD